MPADRIQRESRGQLRMDLEEWNAALERSLNAGDGPCHCLPTSPEIPSPYFLDGEF